MQQPLPAHVPTNPPVLRPEASPFVPDAHAWTPEDPISDSELLDVSSVDSSKDTYEEKSSIARNATPTQLPLQDCTEGKNTSPQLNQPSPDIIHEQEDVQPQVGLPLSDDSSMQRTTEGDDHQLFR